MAVTHVAAAVVPVEVVIAAARRACEIVHRQPGIGMYPLGDYIEAAIRAAVESAPQGKPQ